MVLPIKKNINYRFSSVCNMKNNIISYTLFCVNLEPNPQQNDWNNAMSDCKSFWFSIDTKDEDSIKQGNLNIVYKLIKCLS